MRIYLEHCKELGQGCRSAVIVPVEMQPEVVYHLGRFVPGRTPVQKLDGNKVPHVSLNLPTDQRFYSRRAMSVIQLGNRLRIAVMNSSGVRVTLPDGGEHTYSKNQIIQLPISGDICFTFLGQPPDSVTVQLKVEGDFSEVSANLDVDSTWIGMNCTDFLALSDRAASPGRHRSDLVETLVYLATLIQARWCSQGNEFPSSKVLSRLLDCWLASRNPEVSPLSPKQMTEAGRVAAEMYEMPVAPASAWVSIAQMMISLGALPPREADAVLAELNQAGIDLFESLS